MASPEPLNIIGKRVRAARLKRKTPLTQDELSGRVAALGVTVDRAGISKIESGTRSVLDYELKALAEALGVSVDWLLGTQR
jgi:transcriptional regulator with XRE-family HTH domain